MPLKRRFIASVIRTSTTLGNTALPWERGAPRAAMCARRRAAPRPQLRRNSA